MRVDTVVHRRRLLGVALEADERELGPRDESRVDRRDPDRPPEEILTKAVDEAAQPELRGDVRGRVLVRLPPRDRPHEEDVAAVADVREAQAGHAQHAVDVRVQDGLLVLEVRLRERVAAEREAGVVEEDVDAAELRDRLRHECSGALLVRDVDVQRHVGLDPLHPPRAAHDAHAHLAQLAHGRGTDAAGRAGDDGCLPRELHDF